MADFPAGTIPPPREQVLIVDKPEAGRTALLVGRVSIERSSPDYYPAVVAGAVLSGYSGRLNQEVRVKRGLSYGASASVSPRRLPGLFLASTLVEHGRAVEATEVTLATIRSLAERPAGDDELATRKATVTGGFYRGIETVDGVVGSLAELVLHDAPLSDLNAYVPRVQAVDAEAVRDFAARALVPDNFVVLVGDAAKFADALRGTHGPLTVIAGEALDLRSPGLGG